MDTWSPLPDALRQCMARRNYTQKALAKDAGVSPRTLYAILNEGRACKPTTLKPIADKLGVALEVIASPPRDSLHSSVQWRTRFTPPPCLTAFPSIRKALDKVAVATAPTTDAFAVALDDHSIAVCDAATTCILQKLVGHQAPVTQLLFLGDAILLSTSLDGTTRAWDVNNGQQIDSIQTCGRLAQIERTNSALCFWSSYVDRIDCHEGGWQVSELVHYDDFLRWPIIWCRWVPGTACIAVVRLDKERTLPPELLVVDVHAQCVTQRHVLEHALDQPNCDPDSWLSITSDGHYFVFERGTGFGVIDIQSGTMLYNVTGHGSFLTKTVVTPVARHIITASFDRTLKVWPIGEAGEQCTLQGHRGLVTDVAVSTDSLLVISASEDHTTRFWSTSTGQALHTFDCPVAPRSLVVSGSGHFLIVVDCQGHINVADLQPSRVHQNAITMVDAWVPGTVVLSASLDATIKAWRATDGALLHTWGGFQHRPAALAAVGERRMLAADAAGRVWWDDLHNVLGWDLTTRQQDFSCPVRKDILWSIAVTPDGTTMFGLTDTFNAVQRDADFLSMLNRGCMPNASRSGGDSSGQLRDLVTHGPMECISSWAKEVARFPIARRAVFPGHAAPYVVPLELWNVTESGGRHRIYDNKEWCITSLVVVLDGTAVLLAFSDGWLRRWDVNSQAFTHQIQAHSAKIVDTSVSRNGRVAASAAHDGAVRIWDVAEMMEIGTFRADRNPTATCFISDAEVVIGDEGGNLYCLST